MKTPNGRAKSKTVVKRIWASGWFERMQNINCTPNTNNYAYTVKNILKAFNPRTSKEGGGGGRRDQIDSPIGFSDLKLVFY